MSIMECIATVDALKPNKFSEEQKVEWLSNCDSTIWHDVVLTHERTDGMPEEWKPYSVDEDRNTELLAKSPHDDLYRYWLFAKIDYSNMEMAKYNNSAALFNTMMADFAAWYNRTYTPTRRADHFSL